MADVPIDDPPPALFDDPQRRHGGVAAALEPSKLGLASDKKGRVVIVAECELGSAKITLTAIPRFAEDNKAVVLEFDLELDRPGAAQQRVAVDPQVVQSALARGDNPLIDAADSQFGWLNQHCPEFNEAVANAVLSQTPEALVSKPYKSL